MFSETTSDLEALDHQAKRRILYKGTVARPGWADELPGVSRQTLRLRTDGNVPETRNLDVDRHKEHLRRLERAFALARAIM